MGRKNMKRDRRTKDVSFERNVKRSENFDSSATNMLTVNDIPKNKVEMLPRDENCSTQNVAPMESVRLTARKYVYKVDDFSDGFKSSENTSKSLPRSESEIKTSKAQLTMPLCTPAGLNTPKDSTLLMPEVTKIIPTIAAGSENYIAQCNIQGFIISKKGKHGGASTNRDICIQLEAKHRFTNDRSSTSSQDDIKSTKSQISLVSTAGSNGSNGTSNEEQSSGWKTTNGLLIKDQPSGLKPSKDSSADAPSSASAYTKECQLSNKESSASKSLAKPALEPPGHSENELYDLCDMNAALPMSSNDHMDFKHIGVSVTVDGVISLQINKETRLDLTINRSVRLVNRRHNITIAKSISGKSIALLHPSGRVYQKDDHTEVEVRDSQGKMRYAKVTTKGVSVTNDFTPFVYLVDAAGARTAADHFSDLGQDFSLDCFYGESALHGEKFIDQSVGLLYASNYWKSSNERTWIINRIKITESLAGFLCIFAGDVSIKMSLYNGSVKINTQTSYTTASKGPSRHLFIKKNEKRIHWDGRVIICRDAGQAAGFDENDKFRIF